MKKLKILITFRHLFKKDNIANYFRMEKALQYSKENAPETPSEKTFLLLRNKSALCFLINNL